jgi:hypothetical protein
MAGGLARENEKENVPGPKQQCHFLINSKIQTNMI